MSWESDNRIQSPDTPVKDRSWKDAPLGIKLVVVFYVLNMLFLLAAIGEFAGGEQPAAGLLVVLTAVVGVVGLVCAIGLLDLRPWAYLGIFAITVLFGVVHLVSLNLLQVAVSALVIYLLVKHGDLYADFEQGRE